MTERFTRVDAGMIDYRFTIEDEKTWARPWSAELPFAKMEQQGAVLRACLPRGESVRLRT